MNILRSVFRADRMTVKSLNLASCCSKFYKAHNSDINSLVW